MKHLILGAGNMVSALLPGYIRNAKADHHSFYVYTPSGKSAKIFSDNNDINFLESLDSIKAYEYDVVWLAMKPQGFRSAIEEFYKEGLDFSKAISISIMAGVSVENIAKVTRSQDVIRIMPNTPSKVNLGANLVYGTMGDEGLKNLLKHFLGSSENFYLESEDMMDKLTPFSGSGPAYFFEISRIFETKMIDLGYDKESAKKLLGLTMKGASEMILKDSDSSLELRKKVTSKGGVTFEALKVMEDSNIEEIFSRAIDKAIERNSQLRGE